MIKMQSVVFAGQCSKDKDFSDSLKEEQWKMPPEKAISQDLALDAFEHQITALPDTVVSTRVNLATEYRYGSLTMKRSKRTDVARVYFFHNNKIYPLLAPEDLKRRRSFWKGLEPLEVFLTRAYEVIKAKHDALIAIVNQSGSIR